MTIGAAIPLSTIRLRENEYCYSRLIKPHRLERLFLIMAAR